MLQARGDGALVVEAGSTLNYFTGVQWRSERLTAAVIGADGSVLIVTPGFEEPSIREMLVVPAEVRVWQEDESPAKLIHDWLGEKGLAARPLAVDETVRFFAIDALQALDADRRIVNGAPVVNALRMRKSPAELALMQHANDITAAAYAATGAQIERGMTGADIDAIMTSELVGRGGSGPSGSTMVGPGSALPHGSKVVEKVGPGQVILMDWGCGVDGYRSDISRTCVFGEPTARQREVFQTMRKGQDIAMKAAQIGTPAGRVDDAVRAYYESLGWGPGYRLPGLSHRTGHGIGLDVHEPVNLVHGETEPLAAGMCFSNEPGLYIPGEFGVRLEDCFYMTEEGPKFFTTPPPSLDQPFV
ncbi:MULTISPECIES: M24 family metallopeptidase [Pacificimonas]|uniref:M24 family metallopeptidase n=1 Tax=Pacificimonas TaxID=1960290 RepID=UPI001FB070BC|nr:MULTISPECIES: Xaa-Pro peptidase family protein [Pacificimonas]